MSQAGGAAVHEDALRGSTVNMLLLLIGWCDGPHCKQCDDQAVGNAR